MDENKSLLHRLAIFETMKPKAVESNVAMEQEKDEYEYY